MREIGLLLLFVLGAFVVLHEAPEKQPISQESKETVYTFTSYDKLCIENVVYIKLPSGALTQQYKPDGTIVTC